MSSAPPAPDSAPATSVEHVLVVPTSLFHEVGWFQGFQPDVGPYLSTLLDPAYTSYRPRPEVEQDPSFKQLIPYCVFRCDGKVFHYRRGKLQGEGRLHSKRSIGIGGHISAEDQAHASSVYHQAMQREISEEVYLQTEFREQCLGLINDDETEVGRVHLGIVHVFDLEAPKVSPREESILETGFAQPSELIGDLSAFETWSQICLKYLVEPGR
jgi:predicted NUDIX family phosphoesterase